MLCTAFVYRRWYYFFKAYVFAKQPLLRASFYWARVWHTLTKIPKSSDAICAQAVSIHYFTHKNVIAFGFNLECGTTFHLATVFQHLLCFLDYATTYGLPSDFSKVAFSAKVLNLSKNGRNLLVLYNLNIADRILRSSDQRHSTYITMFKATHNMYKDSCMSHSSHVRKN